MDNWEEDFDKQRLELLKGMTPEQMLRELLADFHGDGGHHTEKVGLAQSVFDAEQRQETRQHEPIVNALKEKIKKLYVEKINSTSLSEDEQELAKSVHNDAISLVIDQLDGNLVNELS